MHPSMATVYRCRVVLDEIVPMPEVGGEPSIWFA
jgi:hypothetical protein